MSTSAIELDPSAVDARVSDDSLHVVLADGRALAAPLAWFPRLRDATSTQRAHWEIVGQGHGIHWRQVDEDISVARLLRLA